MTLEHQQGCCHLATLDLARLADDLHQLVEVW
jgi:hypothetical protein